MSAPNVKAKRAPAKRKALPSARVSSVRASVKANAIALAEEDAAQLSYVADLDAAIDLRRAPARGRSIRTLQRKAQAVREKDLRASVRSLCQRAFQTRFGFAWDDEIKRLTREDRYVAALGRESPQKSGRARALARRALVIRFWDSWAPSSSAIGRHLSRRELAIVSLLVGNWPALRRTDTTARAVLAAEEEHIKSALRLHGAKKVEWGSNVVITRPARGKRAARGRST